jgi:uncharacterized membrane protein HdeD (DUF308 family)
MIGAAGSFPLLGADAKALCAKNWWVFLVGGLAGVVFGVVALFQPVAAWLVVSIFFAADVLVDGVANAFGAIRHRGKDGWWVMLLIGALGIAVGGYLLLNPATSMQVFVLVAAVQAILLGVFLLILGHRVRAATKREWMLYLAGALSVALGVMILLNPLAGAVSVITLIATWAFVTGLVKIAFSFKARRMA